MDSIDYFDKRKRKSKETSLVEDWDSSKKDQIKGLQDKKKGVPSKNSSSKLSDKV